MNEHKTTIILRMLRHIAVLGLIGSSLQAPGSDISGSVINKTKERPATGDDVVLLSLSEGMQETARTKTDTKGHFNLSVPDEGVQHLIRVVHQGVNYHKPAPQGTSSVEVEVYDVAPQVDKIFGEGRVLRLQTQNAQLQVSEMYILRNESTPPRTRMSDRSFEVIVPDGAEIESGMAAGPGGMPVTSAPVPTGQKNHYAFIFPIRPGRTQFQITYHVPYTGNHSFDLSFDIPFAELGVMLPKSMQFKAAGDAFQPANDESGMNTYVVKSVSPGQQIAFTVSGEGTAPREAQNGTAGMPGGAPGGGLGVPVGGDNPMGATTMWYVLGGLVVTLAGGAYFVTHRPVTNGGEPQVSTTAAIAATQEPRVVTVPTRSAPPSPATAARANSVLDLLKEELFQLETDRLQGSISEQEYNEIKSGINALMRRHVGKRS